MKIEVHHNGAAIVELETGNPLPYKCNGKWRINDQNGCLFLSDDVVERLVHVYRNPSELE